MNFVRTGSVFSAVATITMTTSAWAANDEQHDSHPSAATATAQVAQAVTTPGMGMGSMAAMPGYADQMQAMHDTMLAAKTPEERNTLMTKQMKLMHSGMGMMGQMGPGAMGGKAGDMVACQERMDQRMEMMQSMMQMMMDRMAPTPATK
ncbi:MAG: hypothetical protein ACTS6O_08500 [Giesbergeria sp.]